MVAPNTLTARNEVDISTLKMVSSIFLAHLAVNTLLLSPWNKLRCAFWNQLDCSQDEDWICNWFFFSHFHVLVLLGCLHWRTLTMKQMEHLAALICLIIIVYLIQGIHSLNLLDPALAVLQVVVLIGIFAWIQWLTYQDPNDIKPLLLSQIQANNMSVSLSNSSYSRGRMKFHLSTVAVWMHVVSGVMRVIDLTFGEGKAGYRGDDSGLVYQSIMHMSISDMMLVVIILLFSVQYYNAEQQKAVLIGQSVALFLSQVLLASRQGDMMERDMALAGSIGTFVFILVAILGAI